MPLDPNLIALSGLSHDLADLRASKDILNFEGLLMDYLDTRDQISLSGMSAVDAWNLVIDSAVQHRMLLMTPPSSKSKRFSRWRSCWEIILSKLNITEIQSLSSYIFCEDDSSAKVFTSQIKKHIPASERALDAFDQFLPYFAFIEQEQ